jgi:cyclopropane-fatty-acyl-phospholipid synthase
MRLASVTDRAPEGSGAGCERSALACQSGRFLKSVAARRIGEYLDLAGIQVNGPNPWDIRVSDSRFFSRVLRHGSLGLGEAYVDGWWDAERLDEFFVRLHGAELHTRLRTRDVFWLWLADFLLNRQGRTRSAAVARQHYNLGNDLFEAMLDRGMQYTCAYWKDATSLATAQQNKLDLITSKLFLSPGMRVLELGGGFGGLARHLASEHGCEVVSYNISAEQVRYAREYCRGLPVRFVEADYREAARESDRFHRVVSIGLCEHVGHKNHRRFLDLMHGALADGGLCLVHTIGANASWTTTDPWVDKYIFPNGVIPSMAQLGRAAEHKWVIEDWHNFGPDYDRTLMAWWENFDRAWPRLRSSYDGRLYRVWKYYLLACAGAFRARKLQLWQIVLSKGDISGYTPVR